MESAETPADLTDATVESWAVRMGCRSTLVVTVGPEPGEVAISWPQDGPLDAGEWRYDVEVTQNGSTNTWVRGKLGVAQDVTNAP